MKSTLTLAAAGTVISVLPLPSSFSYVLRLAGPKFGQLKIFVLGSNIDTRDRPSQISIYTVEVELDVVDGLG